MQERIRITALRRLEKLLVVEHDPAVEESYDRSQFGHGWDDLDSDGQDERAEILIRFCKPKTALAFASDKEKRVVSGKWRCRFTNDVITDASKLDIDHLIPLKNAWMCGADKWDRERREHFANGFGIKSRKRSWLLPVASSANRAKGAKSPDQWLPPNEKYHARYAAQWIRHKNYWSLSVTPEEKTALKELLK